MAGQKPKVLFFSTGNATRSLIAEGFLRNLTGDRFDVASAAVDPSALNPLAGEVMKEAGIDISGQKPKTVAQSVKERFGYVIAICDTAKERSPIFPFTLHLSHWNIVDPNTFLDCPSKEQKFFAACETKSRTRSASSYPIPHKQRQPNFHRVKGRQPRRLNFAPALRAFIGRGRQVAVGKGVQHQPRFLSASRPSTKDSFPRLSVKALNIGDGIYVFVFAQLAPSDERMSRVGVFVFEFIAQARDLRGDGAIGYRQLIQNTSR